MRALLVAAAAGVCVLGAASARAQLAPGSMNVGVDERLGAPLPTSVLVTDQDGYFRPLSNVTGGDCPVVLDLSYFRCPAMCDATLSRLVETVRAARIELGKDYRVVTLSFDPTDTPAAAAAKRASVLARLGRDDLPAGSWTFAVAGPLEASSIVAAAGIRLVRDEASNQWAHPAVFVVLTPEGRISRYLDGLDTGPRDLELAVVEAGGGRVGSPLDRVLLACYRFDPASRKYAADIVAIMRAGGAAIALVVGAVLAAYWRRERQRSRGKEAR